MAPPSATTGTSTAYFVATTPSRRSEICLRLGIGVGEATSRCKPMDKSCLGCNAKPPSLSTKAIRSISSTLCDLDASQVTDAALSKKKKSQPAPVGAGYQKKKDAATPSKNDDAPKQKK